VIIVVTLGIIPEMLKGLPVRDVDITTITTMSEKITDYEKLNNIVGSIDILDAQVNPIYGDYYAVEICHQPILTAIFVTQVIESGYSITGIRPFSENCLSIIVEM
jgi:hypothetical protein